MGPELSASSSTLHRCSCRALRHPRLRAHLSDEPAAHHLYLESSSGAARKRSARAGPGRDPTVHGAVWKGGWVPCLRRLAPARRLHGM